MEAQLQPWRDPCYLLLQVSMFKPQGIVGVVWLQKQLMTSIVLLNMRR